jgi:hypothetical protein
MVASNAALPRGDVPVADALRSARAVVSAGAVVGAAGVAVNLLAAVVPAVAARPLPADQFGAFAALLAVGTVAAVVGVALQTALAVKWARHDRVEGATRLSLLTAGATTAVLLLVSPLLAAGLRLPAIQTLWLAVLTCPVVLAGRWLGELQGRQRYGRLAIGMVLLGVGRYGGLLAALAAGLGVTATLAVGAVAAWASMVLIAWFTSRDGPAASTEPAAERVTGIEVVRAGGATIAMLAISYADLILARALLPEDDAGRYGVGSLLTKGALWAPGVLTVLALPLFAQARHNAVRITLAATAAVGAVLILASAFAGGFAMRLAGGADYAHLGPYAAAFASVGALYALVFVIVNAEIAKLGRRPALTLWAGLAGMATIAVVTRPSTVGGVLTLSVGTAGVTLVSTTAVYLIRLHRMRARTGRETAVSTAPTTSG